jgi:putative inorganic carbon (HCO3(-)) transporter
MPGLLVGLRRRHAWLCALAAFLVLGGMGFAAFLLPPTLYAALLAAGAVALAWLVLPEGVILALLLARSSVDGFMELFTLFAGSSLSMNLSGAVNSMAVGLGLLALGRRVVRRQSLLVAGPGWTYALFLLASLISIPGSVDMAGGIKEWARLASGLAIYLMVAEIVRDEHHARRFAAAILVSSLLPLAVAVVQRLTGGGYFFLGFVGTEFANRPQGTFGHPAALGSYLVILLTLAVTLYYSISSRPIRALLLGWAAVATGVLAFTLARTQWLGMVIAGSVLGLLKRWRLAMVAIAITVVLLLTVPLLRERLGASHSVGWRLDLWQASTKLAWPPTLRGLGLATSPWHINQLLPKVEAPPHDDYLKAVIETGLLGFATYGVWLLALLRHAWLAYRQAQQPVIAWRATGLLAVIVAGCVMSISDNYLGYTAVQWYLWALVALVPVRGCWPAGGRVEALSQTDTLMA